MPPSRGAGGRAPIRVLIGEDASHLATTLGQFLTACGFAVSIASTGRAVLDKLRTEAFDVALLDLTLPDVDGIEVLRQMRDELLPTEIIITGSGTIETALAALKLGAYDFLATPCRMADLEAVVRRAGEKRALTRDNAMLQSRLKHAASEPRFVTQYAPLLAVLSLIDRVAPSGSPVLVSGESGTGKDLIARLLHDRGGGADGPFVDLNCSALSDLQVEMELFGVEKGAFPGAEHRSTGLIELAAGGTLYLDNIHDLGLKLQGKLLRALETANFYRVGGTRKIDVNVRLVASTTRDLSRMAAAGMFREDLLHRINTIRVALPSLRERAVDVPLLSRHFLGLFGGAAPPTLTPDAEASLERYRWPGNVRELRNVIERAVLLVVNGVIGARDLPLGVDVGAGARATPTNMLTLSELERQHIADVLEHSHWHQGRAAELLGISPKTLYRKIREYRFRRPPGRSA